MTALVDELEIEPGSIVSIPGMGFGDDTAFVEAVRGRASKVYDGTIDPDVDVIFMKTGSALELSSLKRLQKSMKPSACVWVVWPKGKPKLTEDDVRKAAGEAGMEGVKLTDFSDTHSALKLVIQAADRS